jgi:phosphotransferase system IIA component
VEVVAPALRDREGDLLGETDVADAVFEATMTGRGDAAATSATYAMSPASGPATR